VFRDLRDQSEIPDPKIRSPGIDSSKKAVCAAYTIDGGDISTSRRGITNGARKGAIHLCRLLPGETPASIGMEACLHKYGSVGSVMKRMKRALADDKRLKKRIKRLGQHLNKAQNET
jgi:hypothetical protein